VLLNETGSVVPVADVGMGTLGGFVFERRAAKKRHSAGPRGFVRARYRWEDQRTYRRS